MTQQPPTGTADPTTAADMLSSSGISLPDIPDISSSAHKFIESLESSASALTSFTKMAISFGDGASGIIGKMSSAIGTAASYFDNANSSSKDATSSANSFAATLGKIGEVGLTVLEANLIGGFKSADDVIKSSTGNLNNFENQTSGVVTILGNMKNLGLDISKIPGVNIFGNVASSYGQTADAFTRVRSTILSTAAAGGRLNDTLGEMSNLDMSKLNDQIVRQGAELIQSAAAIGTSTSNYIAAYKAIQESTPNFFKDQKINVGGADLTELQAVMSLSEGTQESIANISSKISTLGKTYNLASQDALEYIAKLSKVNNEYHIGSDTIKSFFDKNTQAFAYQITDAGDNSVNTLNRMMRSLQDTGLSAKQSAELIGDITSGIGKMDVATKAFLSSQTGGSGGLKGAFEIENLIKQGKTDEVMKKVEENIKKNFGGKIFTLEEAGRSDYAASQFMMQREMLKSGAFGISNLDDAKASRLLESMSRGSGTIAGDLGDAFQNYAGAGKTMLQENVTPAAMFNASLDIERLSLGKKSLEDLIGQFGVSKDALKAINDSLLEIRDRNKDPDKAQKSKDVTIDFANSVSKGGGRMGAAADLIVGVSGMMRNKRKTKEFEEASEKAESGLKGIISQPAPSSDQVKNQSTNQESAKQKATKRPQNQKDARQNFTEKNVKEVVDYAEDTDKNEDRPARPSPQVLRVNPARTMYNTSPATLSASTQSNSTATNNQAAYSDSNMVVPTVEMQVNMTCPNCNGKTKEVVVIKTNKNETGGLTSVPLSRPV